MEELARADFALRKLQITLGAEGRTGDVTAVFTVRQIILGIVSVRAGELEVAVQELGIERVN